MATIEFVDQTIRDGHQSLWGMRMHPGWTTGAAPSMDRAGYRVIDCTGGNQFAVQLRHVHQDPWAGLDLIRGNFPRTPLRAGKRWNAVGVFGHSPNAIVDLFNQTMIKHGIQSIWLYDCLYNMAPWERACRVVHEAGARVLPSIMYGIGPSLTDEFFAGKVREIVGWGFADSIYFEDAAGILKPERAATLMPALVEAASGLPVEMHCHNTTGLAPLNYLEGVQAGVRILHTASRPLANGPSLPSIEATAQNLLAEGHEPSIDLRALEQVADHFQRIADQEGLPTGVPVEYDARVYQHQLPGGMTGTLKAQLVQHGVEHRLSEVLDEIVQVRADLGYPISATPFSQLVGIQALLNVSTDERYGVVPEEVIMYALGHLGPPLEPIDPDVMDRILAAPRAKDLASWVKPDPSLEDLHKQYGGPGVSDEELLSRYLAPESDLEATRAAGPPPRDYVFRTPSFAETVKSALAVEHSNYIHFEQEGLSVTLRRRPLPTAVGG